MSVKFKVKDVNENEASLKWIEGFQFLGYAREHSVIIDQKKEDGGENLGFKPTELLLLALGGCLGSRIVAEAMFKGLKIEDLKLDIGISRAARASESNAKWLITVKVHIKGDISKEEKEEIVEKAEKYCKISHILKDTCEIQVEVVS